MSLAGITTDPLVYILLNNEHKMYLGGRGTKIKEEATIKKLHLFLERLDFLMICSPENNSDILQNTGK